MSSDWEVPAGDFRRRPPEEANPEGTLAKADDGVAAAPAATVGPRPVPPDGFVGRMAEEDPTYAAWLDRTRVFLQPVAPPSILGLWGFAIATFLVSGRLAGIYGTPKSPSYIFEFAAMAGGLAQFTAAVIAHRARDGVGAGIHGVWGAFWLAYGIINLLVTVGVLFVPITGKFSEFGFWFIGLAVVTLFGTVAAAGQSAGFVAVLAPLTAGSVLLAIRYLTGVHGWGTAGGWVLQVSSWMAFMVGGALMLEGAWGRVVLPLGTWARSSNVPGAVFTRPLEYERGEPGIRMGQGRPPGH
jgi:uncharacterized protein